MGPKKGPGHANIHLTNDEHVCIMCMYLRYVFIAKNVKKEYNLVFYLGDKV